MSQLRKQLAAAQEAEDQAATAELSRRIVSSVPNDSATWQLLAQTLLQLKDYERLGPTLDAWQKASKNPPAAIENFRGDLAFEKEDYQGAERHWLAFLSRNPSRSDAADAYDKLSDLCVEKARWTDVEKYRAKAVAAEDSATRRVWHATALLRLHRWDAAFAEMAKANKMDSTDAQVKEWLPQFERLQPFVAEIKSLDAQLVKAPQNVDRLLDRARLFTLAGRPLLALDDSQRALKLQPGSMRARVQTGEAFLDDKQDEEAAKVQISPQLTRTRDGHVSEQALRELREADHRAEANLDDATPLAARSRTLRGLRQFSLALADAQAALALSEDYAAAYAEAAYSLGQLNRSKEALEEAVRATELNTKDADAWLCRGLLEAQRADCAAAIKSLTRSIELAESVAAVRQREQCERQTGNVKEADADAARLREMGANAE